MYTYLGDCKSTVDVDKMWDATQMAQLIEESEPLDFEGIKAIIPTVTGPFDGGFHVATGIYWVYDREADTHYFYVKET
jgi:hypothetical protein